MSEVVVLGAGAWGTALAIQAVRAGNDVVLFARNGADAIAASRESPRLPGHRLPEQVRITGDKASLAGTIIAVLAVALFVWGGIKMAAKAAGAMLMLGIGAVAVILALLFFFRAF